VSADQLVAVAAIVMFASVVQVSAGFGFGLLAVPAMTLVIEPREAIVVSTMLGCCVSTWQTVHLREYVEHHTVHRMTAAAYAGMPLGLWVFVAVDDSVLRFALGVAVLLSVVLLAGRINVDHVGRSLELGGGFLSGILNTSLSTNGPPLVFVLQARGLAADPFRGTISRIFAWCNIGAITGFVATGKVTRDGLIAAAVALPAMILGQVLGLPMRRHIHGERMRWLVLVLLSIAGLSAIVAAFR
jgi:uncharacterized membrane protein YfcA